MEIVKKIGLVLALITLNIIKIPFLIIQFIVNTTITLFTMVAYKIVMNLGLESVISGWNLAMDINTNQAIDAECMFEDMRIEL